tara:strand:- start:378 stop:1430 length:1053 start_codon:yes stop_codon:yes gene_type:complete
MVKIEDGIKLDFSDVLIKPKRSTLSSRKEVVLERTFKGLYSNTTWTGIPIMISNMDTTGTFQVARTASKHKILTILHKHYTIDEWNVFLTKEYYNILDTEWDYYGISTGISDNDFEKTKQIFKIIPNIKILIVDVANGYTELFIETIKKYRKEFPDKLIFAGNVVTAEMTEALILAGADGVKVGIGNGAVCTTRIQTGVGVPQLSAIMECADAAHGLNGLIISDGGNKNPGDFSKAFGANTDFIMSGSTFAGTYESAGELKEIGDKLYKEYYGMSSKVAMDKHAGGVAEYRSSEGKLVQIEYKGKLEDVIKDLLGGIRSACTYTGSKTLKELSKRCTFVLVHNQVNTLYC